MDAFFTVRDSVQLLQNYGVKLENENEGLSNPICNITFFVDKNPDKSMLMGRELIIIPQGQIEIDKDNAILAFLNDLADNDISALMFYYDIGTTFKLSSQVLAHANKLKIPLMSVEKSVAYSTIASEIYMAIFNYGAFDWTSYSRIITEFSNLMLLPKAPLSMVADKLADIVQQDVIVLDSYGFVITHVFISGNQSLLTCSEMHNLFTTITKSFSGNHPDEMLHKQVIINNRHYLYTLYRAQFAGSLYYIVLINDHIDKGMDAQFVKAALFQATRAIALIKSKDMERYRIKENELTDFYDALFYDNTLTEQQLMIKAARCGIDLNGKHQAIKINLSPGPGYENSFLIDGKIKETLTSIISNNLRNYFKKVFIIAAEGGFAVFVQRCNNYSEEIHQKLFVKTLMEITKALKSGQPIISVCFGVGREQESIFMLRDSLCQANNAIKLGQKIACPGNIYFYGEMGIYSWLSAESMEHFRKICRNELISISESLGKNADITLDTLEVYFDTNCNFKETAQTMNIHINTVKYRIDKAKSILNSFAIKNGEERLKLHLLLKIRHLL